MEELAEKVIRDQFDELLNTSSKPIELDIKLVPMGQVTSEVEDITEVPQNSDQPTKKDQEEQDKRDQENDKEEKDRSEKDKSEEKDKPEKKEVPGTDLISAIDKKKILNMITQAAGKSTKDIIKASDIVDEGLQEIFGDSWRRILACWTRMSDLADKMDWVIPISRKADMMKHVPGGMAGACEIKWESVTGNYYDIKLLLEKEATKIVIHSTGVDFPMLIHETIKGIYLFLQSGAIKKDKKTSEIIRKATSSFMDEAQDFRYGPMAFQMLLMFINKFPESTEYKRLDTRVFTMLSVDKERAIIEAKSAKPEYKEFLEKKAKIARNDNEFLEIMKSLFSVFDLQGNQLVVNESKFNDSLAKREIKKIIDYIVDDIEEYNRELSEWEREEAERKYLTSDEKESSKEDIVKKEKEEDIAKKEIDYSELSQMDLQNLIDDALDANDLDKVRKISKFLRKESAEIYLREIERINESYNHTRK